MLAVGRIDGSLQMAVFSLPCPAGEGSDREALVSAWHPARVNPLLHVNHSSQLQPTNTLLRILTPKPSLSFPFLFLFIYSSVFYFCVATVTLETVIGCLLFHKESDMTFHAAIATLLSVKALEG